MSSPNADRLIVAFVEYLGSRDEYVAVRKRGGDPGYVHVVPLGFDPTKFRDRHVAVELLNGTVCVTKPLKDKLGAKPRPNVDIHTDPLGPSIALSCGRFKWALPFQDVEAWTGGVPGFVKDVCALLEGIKGRKTLDTADEGTAGGYDE